MWIARVRVNGGFLAGLDVQLAKGLNVVVGPRGAGKTTLLELIRHALGIEHADEGQAKRQRANVAHLLGAGEVILELQDAHSSYHVVVDATGGGRSASTKTIALALGQNELEQIASNSQSRLNLIDMRASVNAEPPNLGAVASLTQESMDLRDEIDKLREIGARKAVLEEEKRAAIAEEERLLEGAAADMTRQRESLRTLETELLQIDAQAETVRFSQQSAYRASELSAELGGAVGNLIPGSAGVALLALSDRYVTDAKTHISALETGLGEYLSQLEQLGENLHEKQDRLRVQAEPIRASLETAEVGLGQITARLRNIEAELAQLTRMGTLLQEHETRLTTIQGERASLLDEYEAWQESLYEARQRVAAEVSDQLENRAVLIVEHLSDSTAFQDTLVTLLQGSGLHYRSVVEKVATAILPRQLLTYVEDGGAEPLALASGISADRASKVIAHLSNSDSLTILAKATLDDRVDFLLREGAIEKSVERLSTGQKCAVTLPIVLTEPERILILDQPEDHLDNAYLVNHVVKALEERSQRPSQTLVATHNANIPVLGSAPMVISLDSDGTRGFISNKGPFDDDAIVSVITSLMEGGRQAFERRAEFYAAHGDDRG